MSRHVALFVTSSLAALSLAGLAQAQGTAPADAGNTIEELVITAEKRSQSLQDVPVAVSAYTGEKRDLLGITTVQDISNFTPGLSYLAGTDRVSLRGIGRLSNNLAAESAVASYVDLLFTTSLVEASRSPLFVDRIEVLRGPQGTLYGRNAIGGAINTVSRRPTDDFYAEGRLTIGNYERFVAEGAVSGPITEGLRARLAVLRPHQGKGYFKNLYDGTTQGGKDEFYYIEGQIEADLGERAEFWLKAAISKWDPESQGPGGRNFYNGGVYETAFSSPSFSLSPVGGFAYNPTAVALGAAVGGVSNVVASPRSTNPALLDPREFDSNTVDAVSLQESRIISSHFTYHLDTFDVKYIFGHQNYTYHLLRDFDGVAVDQYRFSTVAGPVTLYPSLVLDYLEDHDWWTHEINVASTGDSPFQWIVGGYYFVEHIWQPVSVTGDARQTQLLSGLVPAIPGQTIAANPNGWYNFTNHDLRNETLAGFGQIDWKFTSTLKTTLGLRYTKDKKAGEEFLRQVCFNPACGAPLTSFGPFAPAVDLTGIYGNILVEGAKELAHTDPATGIRSRAIGFDWNAWTGTAGLEWTPNTDTMAYAKFSRGYKAGGFNSGNLSNGLTTDKETVDAYEAGAKLQFGGNVQINTAVFYYNYYDAQVPVTVNRNGVNSGEFFNIPKSISKGVEVEAIWQPVDNLQILANYSYNDAHITEATGLIDSNDVTATQPGAKPFGAPSAGQQGQDLSGNDLPNAPHNKVALNANYTFDFEPGSLTFSGSYLWRDEQWGAIFQRDYNRAPSWDQVDLRATWRDAADRYTVILYGKNVFDDEGYDAGPTAVRRANTTYSSSYTLTPPRTYGVELQYRF